MSTRLTPPFRADHVGSLLRPANLHAARADHAAGRITAAQLEAVEDAAIGDAVRLQEEAGLKSATDGEFRREQWHADYLYSIPGIRKGALGPPIPVFRKDEQISWAPNATEVLDRIHLEEPIFGGHFTFLKETVTTALPKLTVPSPNMVQCLPRSSPGRSDPPHSLVARRSYLAPRSSVHCGGAPLRLAVRRRRSLSVPAVAHRCSHCPGQQRIIDDVFASQTQKQRSAGMPPRAKRARSVSGPKRESRGMSDGRTEDLGSRTPGCERESSAGSPASQRAATVSGPRSGARGTSAERRWEDIVLRRAGGEREGTAAKYVDLERLCLSGQCGFASTVEGNSLTIDEERAKLELIASVAEEIWG